MDPLTRLWLNVIKRAVADIQGKIESTASRPDLIRKGAWQWLISKDTSSSSFIWICTEVMDVDPDIMREGIIEALRWSVSVEDYYKALNSLKTRKK